VVKIPAFDYSLPFGKKQNLSQFYTQLQKRMTRTRYRIAALDARLVRIEGRIDTTKASDLFIKDHLPMVGDLNVKQLETFIIERAAVHHVIPKIHHFEGSGMGGYSNDPGTIDITWIGSNKNAQKFIDDLTNTGLSIEAR
jgi:hypothetical protein